VTEITSVINSDTQYALVIFQQLQCSKYCWLESEFGLQKNCHSNIHQKYIIDRHAVKYLANAEFGYFKQKPIEKLVIVRCLTVHLMQCLQDKHDD